MNWTDVLAKYGASPVIWKDGNERTYAELVEETRRKRDFLSQRGLRAGEVVFLYGDFDFDSIAAFFAILELKCTVVPFVYVNVQRDLALQKLSCATSTVRHDNGRLILNKVDGGTHELIEKLKQSGHPGLILFSSGGGGTEKAILHDFNRLSTRFAHLPEKHGQRKPDRTVAFLVFDHIGGQNTMLATLASGGCLIALPNRSVGTTSAAILNSRATVLPCSPTFLRLLLATNTELAAVRLITYGTEVMPASVLRELHRKYPKVMFKQTYGLSETGILPTRSPESGSTFFQAGDAKNQIRIVDGKIEIFSSSLMLGYLNAESPFTPDGWFRTGDLVEIKDDTIRVRGRESGSINVGGLKVNPSEIEDVLSQIIDFVDVVVDKETHPILGEVAVAHVNLRTPLSNLDVVKIMQNFCKGRLEPFKIPQKVVIHTDELYTGRFKRKRFFQP